jgi:hypothetical protein
MTHKQLKHLAIAASNASAVQLTQVRGGSTDAMHHVRDGWIRDLYLTATNDTSDTRRVYVS